MQIPHRLHAEIPKEVDVRQAAFRHWEVHSGLCEYKGVEIIEAHAMPDRIHMLARISPKLAVSSFMGYLKGKTSLMIFDEHADLKYNCGSRHFWSEGYYMSTVGLRKATVAKYIREQELEAQMQDRRSLKEYKDPFTGKRWR